MGFFVLTDAPEKGNGGKTTIVIEIESNAFVSNVVKILKFLKVLKKKVGEYIILESAQETQIDLKSIITSKEVLLGVFAKRIVLFFILKDIQSDMVAVNIIVVNVIQKHREESIVYVFCNSSKYMIRKNIK